MRAAIFLLLVFAAAVTAFCPVPVWRQFVYAKGQAKVKVYTHYEVKDLRVELVSYSARDPKNVTVMANANADDNGFYVIAGSAQVWCHNLRQFGLRLYAPKIGAHPVEVGTGVNYDRIEVPLEYVNYDKQQQPVKVFEKDIDGVKSIIS